MAEDGKVLPGRLCEEAAEYNEMVPRDQVPSEGREGVSRPAWVGWERRAPHYVHGLERVLHLDCQDLD